MTVDTEPVLASGPPTSSRAGQMLGRWLLAKRETVKPAEAGLPVSTRRRSDYLTQEEVAWLAGCTARTYRALENGHNVKSWVLDGVVAALRLDSVEEAYVRRLAAASRGGIPSPASQAPPWLLGVVTDQVTRASAPSFALDHRWSIVAANAALRRAAPGLAEARTLPDWFFTTAEAARVLVDWAAEAVNLVGAIRAAQAYYPDDIEYAQMMDRVAAANPTARELSHRFHLAAPQPVSTCRVRCKTGEIVTLTVTRTEPVGDVCPGLHVVELHPRRPAADAAQWT